MRNDLSILRSLRAMRRFRPDEISESTLRELIDAARWTGSARNRQPWRVTVITDPEQRVALARLGAYAKLLADAPLVVTLAIDRDNGGADADFDAGRFAQTLMLAAHARGLGSCPVSFFPAPNIQAATAMTGLWPSWEVRTAIAIGRPDAPLSTGERSAIPTGRLSVDEITTWTPGKEGPHTCLSLLAVGAGGAGRCELWLNLLSSWSWSTVGLVLPCEHASFDGRPPQRWC